MSDDAVRQTQMLDAIMKEQLNVLLARRVIIFGIATGNGLRHINPARTHEVIGIDINAGFLAVCRERYDRGTYFLRLIEADMDTATFTLPPADLIIANLFLEYVDLHHWIVFIRRCIHPGTLLSVVLQRNNGAPFVTDTGNVRLQPLADCHHDLLPEDFITAMERYSFVCHRKEIHDLPGQKQFIRIDLTMKKEAQ